MISDEMESVQDSEVSDLKEKVTMIESIFNIPFTLQLEELSNRELTYEHYLEDHIKSYIENPLEDEDLHTNESKVIKEIFHSLINEPKS